MKCKNCGKEASMYSKNHGYCSFCNVAFSIAGSKCISIFDPATPPSEYSLDSSHFDRGSIVICVDRRNKYFLEYGIVEDNDLMHVRIDFKGIKIWMDKKVVNTKPEDW